MPGGGISVLNSQCCKVHVAVVVIRLYSYEVEVVITVASSLLYA